MRKFSERLHILRARQSHASTRRLSFEWLESRQVFSNVFGAYLNGIELYTNAELDVRGLVGSYVNRALPEVTDSNDWRITQPISGTRTDFPVEFVSRSWGTRAAVGLTSGTDADWDNFAVQWDGYLKVTQAGQRLATVSDDGSRMWIDLNLDGVFGDSELYDNRWGQWQSAATGDRTGRLAVGLYPIRIQYYEGHGENHFQLASSSYVPVQFISSPTNPVQTVRVLAISFDPRVPSEDNRKMHEVFGWNDPRKLASQFEADVEWSTGGAIDIQLVEWRELDAFPTFVDGFRYNPDEYVAKRLAGSGWVESGTDLYELVRSQDLTSHVNAGSVDELWLFGDHFFSLLGEAWMAGPNSFFINGPTFSDIGFNRAIAGYGFNYERGIGEMLHNLSHRVENHGQRAFGSWNLAHPISAWDRFSANFLDTTSGPFGVGTCHVPANADAHYDYGDPRTVQSQAFDFQNYPNLTGETRDVSPASWRFGPFPDDHRDYLNWYLAMIPRNDGFASDGRAANWFKYIWDFNAYEPNSGLRRQETAVGSAVEVVNGGGTSHEVTVTYYDIEGIDPSTIGAGDVVIVDASNRSIATSYMGSSRWTRTTAGWALAVSYQFTPPGGTWDSSDNGVFKIVVKNDEVRDLLGRTLSGGQVGSFHVSVPDGSIIDVRRLLEAGQAMITHTELDIGSIPNLFDGNASSLIRTANINPAIITLELNTATAIYGFRTYFSHTYGDPAYQYTVEIADSLADLQRRTGTYRLLTHLAGARSDEYAVTTLGQPVMAKLIRMTATRLAGDDYVHINEWQLVGAPQRDLQAPEASLLALKRPRDGDTSQFVTVEYRDQTGIRVPSLDTGDLVVVGPNGERYIPSFYDVDGIADGEIRLAKYWFVPPGGTWDDDDRGNYQIVLRRSEVRDVLGNRGEGEVILGTLNVDVNAIISWQNRERPLDVNHDGVVTTLDVLGWINHVNQFGVRPVPDGVAPQLYYDVNDDRLITPRDLLLVINWLNRNDARLLAEGEAETREVQTNTAIDPALGVVPLLDMWEPHAPASPWNWPNLVVKKGRLGVRHR